MKVLIAFARGIVALLAGVVATAAMATPEFAVRPDPLNPNAQVAPTRYESFLPARAVAPSGTSPADNWKAANQTVGSFDSMSATMNLDRPPEQSATEPSDQPRDAASHSDAHAAHMKRAEPSALPATHTDRKAPMKSSSANHAGHAMSPVAHGPHEGHDKKEKK